jgi:hypothetical protein
MRRAMLVGIGVIVATTIGMAQANDLDQEAREYSTSSLNLIWLSFGGEYWVYYSVPPNNFTPLLGQNGPVMRFVEARSVSMSVQATPLSEADRLNGLEWKGVVRVTAEAAREYDCSMGWKQWVSRPALIVFHDEKRNGTWHGTYQVGLLVPGNASFQRPEPDELPGVNAGGPRDGKICSQAPVQPPPAAVAPCGLRHNPDGTVSGRACY